MFSGRVAVVNSSRLVFTHGQVRGAREHTKKRTSPKEQRSSEYQPVPVRSTQSITAEYQSF